MYSVLLTAVLSGAAATPAQGQYGSYAGFSGYDRNPLIPIPPVRLQGPCPPTCPPGGPCPLTCPPGGPCPLTCPPGGTCPQACPPVSFPVFGGVLVGEDSDRLDEINKVLRELERLVKDIDRRLGKMKKRMDRSESEVNSRLDAGDKAAKQLAISQDELFEMVEVFETKLSERIKSLAKTIDLRITEEKLNSGLEAIKDREKIQESFQRELRQIEDRLAAVQTQKAEDGEARAVLRGIEEKIAGFQALKDRLDHLEARSVDRQATDKHGFQALKSRLDHLEARSADRQATDKNGFQVPSNRALVIVDLPADAHLYLEGKLTQGDASLRAFITPELEMGASYSYTLRVEFTRQGRTESQTRQVYFRAGNQVRVNFNSTEPMPAAAARN